MTIESASNLTMRLFVYGTLKRGRSRAHYLRGATLLGRAVTRPLYRLVACGDYPGLVPWQPGTPIQGELWEVTQQCLQILDQVEGVPSNLYQRAEVQLQHPRQSGPVFT
ncbi:MAG: gamma-glutamylcyclotransferase family protein, partial [Planctomycetaceae bacterium]